MREQVMKRYSVYMQARGILTAIVPIEATSYEEAAKAAWANAMSGTVVFTPRAVDRDTVGISLVLDLSDLASVQGAPDAQVSRYVPPEGARAKWQRKRRGNVQ